MNTGGDGGRASAIGGTFSACVQAARYRPADTSRTQSPKPARLDTAGGAMEIAPPCTGCISTPALMMPAEGSYHRMLRVSDAKALRSTVTAPESTRYEIDQLRSPATAVVSRPPSAWTGPSAEAGASVHQSIPSNSIFRCVML